MEELWPKGGAPFGCSKMLEFVSPISEAYDIILIQVDILISY